MKVSKFFSLSWGKELIFNHPRNLMILFIITVLGFSLMFPNLLDAQEKIIKNKKLLKLEKVTYYGTYRLADGVITPQSDTKASDVTQTVLFDNTTETGSYYPPGANQEILDWATLPVGGEVDSFEIGYATTKTTGTIEMDIIFYTGTDRFVDGTEIASFSLTGLPVSSGGAQGYIISVDITGPPFSPFTIPEGEFGYKYVLKDDDTGPVFATGGTGIEDVFREPPDPQNYNFGGDPYAQFYLLLEGEAGEPDQITVTSPNGGESWEVGTEQAITWESSGSIPDVKIEYTTSGGLSWSTIDSSTDNDGSYPWNVTGPASTNCWVRLSDASDGDPEDMSDSPFSIISGGEVAWFHQISGTHLGLYSVFFLNADTGWIVGEDGLILKTTDGGVNWEAQNSGTINTMRSVYFINSDIGWAAAKNTILKTIDGGISWTSQMVETDNSYFEIHFHDANTGWAVGSLPTWGGGIISKTTNGGLTWSSQTISTSLQGLMLISVHFIDDNTGWTVGTSVYGDGGMILNTSNGGSTWQTQLTAPGRTFFDVHFVDANNGWVVGDKILNTQSGGLIWSEQPSETDETLESVHFIDNQNGWAVGSNILRTLNAGANWVLEDSVTNQSLISVYFNDSYSGWAVGYGGTILKYGLIDPTNNSPVVQNEIPDTTLALNPDTLKINLDGPPAVFIDPDGDDLGYIVQSSDPDVASVSISGSIVTVTPESEGSTKITVEAFDGKGGKNSTDFTVMVGIPTEPSLPWEGCLLLDGGDDYAQTPDHTELDIGDETVESLTVEAWVNFSTFGSADIVTKPNAYTLYTEAYTSMGAAFRGLGFVVRSGGSDQFVSTGFTIYGGGFWISGWHHVAGVYDKTTGQLGLYMDGEQINSAGPGQFEINNSDQELRVGSQLDGQIEEIRISDNARYANSTYTVPTSPFEADEHTRSLWHFDESDGSTQCHDSSGEDNLLICHNGAHIQNGTPVIYSSFEIPEDYQLYQNYPNPFNPETTIKYQLPAVSEVTIRIYNITGKLLKTLVNETQIAGNYSTHWDGKDYTGNDVASGVYFCSFMANDFVKTMKMLRIR